jgi:5-methylcytosine-specific restriction protein A
MALSHCLKPGCPELVEERRCEEHRKEYERANGRAGFSDPDGRRHDGNFYSTAFWRRKRNNYLATHPVCEVNNCERPPREVDHVVPRAEGGSDDSNNLQALCKSHHSQKTARETGFAGPHHPDDRPEYEYPHRRQDADET